MAKQDVKIEPTVVPDLIWDPIKTATEFASKISARTRHVCVFLGAGASCAAGLPNVTQLQELVLKKLTVEEVKLAETLFATGNFESGLSRLRKIRSLLSESQIFDGFTKESAANLDKKLTNAIVNVLEEVDEDYTAVNTFCSWVAGDYYTKPVEIFTVNYDLLLERGLEHTHTPYFDGFVGNIRAGFRGDLTETTGTASDAFPSSFARLWKLHGSLNWELSSGGDIVRTGQALKEDQVAAIYPSDEKYDQSRRVPFVILQDRLRKALATPETITIVSGYSFGDQHLNEIIFDAALRYPRSEIVALFRSSIPEDLKNGAIPNLSLYGAAEAVIGGELRRWSKPERSDIEDIWNDDKFQLGNFEALASFIGRSRSSDTHPASAAQLIEQDED